MRRVAFAAALLVPVLVPVGTSQASSGCAADFEQRGRWHPLSAVGVVAMEDVDPCRLVAVGPGGAVKVSDDGGAQWQDRGTAPAEAAAVVTAGLRPGAAALLGRQGGLWTTTDWARSWTKATGVSGSVLDVVADENTTGRLYAVLAPGDTTLPVTLPVGASSSLLRSDDAGRSFSAVTGAAALAVTAVVPDAGVPSRLWVGVGGSAGGLFLSEDLGSTFTRAAGGDVRDLASSRLAGGGSEVVAATTSGVLVSRDDGVTVDNRSTGTALSEIALEWEHPSAFMALSSTTAVRSADTGLTVRPQGAGLPSGCAPTHLRRDRSVPSVFLSTCSDGRAWRYRSDGTDLSSTDSPNGSLPSPQIPTFVNQNFTPMKELGRHSLPTPGSRRDGSIAFDGSILYYTDQRSPGVVHRMVARSGAGLPDLVIDGPDGLTHIAYDANRNHLFVLDTKKAVWDIDARRGRGVRLFSSPLRGNGSMTYDNATQRLLFAGDHADSIDEYDLGGRLQHSCPTLGLAGYLPISGGVSSTDAPDIASIVATGDGLLYIETEDDSTVFRADRSCHVLASFQHDGFSEAPAENDAMACDTVTFPRSAAIWLRDADAGTVVAYAVSSGYCALPSALTVTAPRGVATGHSGTVCAQLTTLAKHEPVAGVPVEMLVAGRGIGNPITSRSGVACTRYVPLSGEAGAGAASASARQPVVAAFLGTPAYRPSTAKASLVVSRQAFPPPPPVLPPVSHPYVAALVVAPPPPPPVQPPPPPPNVPQTQPIAQGHPGAQPGAMGALGAAPAPEEEQEAAVQAGDVHKMSALGDASWEAYALPLLAGLAMGTVAVRRRRASRVRPQF